jgi:hypothetical protein
MSNTDEKKLTGFRSSVRGHIEKFTNYPDVHDKETALKTISKDQGHIKDVLRKHPHWDSDRMDTWQPPSDWRKYCK